MSCQNLNSLWLLFLALATMSVCPSREGVFFLTAYAQQYRRDPRFLASPTSGFVIRPNAADTFAVAARNLLPVEVLDSRGSTQINPDNAEYLLSAKEHIWSTPQSGTPYQPFSTRTGAISSSASSSDPSLLIRTEGLEGLPTAVETWEGIRITPFASITSKATDMDGIAQNLYFPQQQPPSNMGQTILEFTLDSTDIAVGVFNTYNRSRLVWNEAAIRRDIYSALVGGSSFSSSSGGNDGSAGGGGSTNSDGTSSFSSSASYSYINLLPQADVSVSKAASSRGAVMVHIEDLFPGAPSPRSGYTYVNDSAFVNFFHEHFQVYSQDSIIATTEATRRVPCTPARLRSAVDLYSTATVSESERTRRGVVLRILLGPNPNFHLRLLDATVPLVLPLSRWIVVEDVTWVPPVGTTESTSLRPSRTDLFAPEDMSMHLRFLTTAPSAFKKNAVFAVCCAMGVGAIATGGGGWMGLTSLQTLLLSTTATGCTEPFTDFLFRGTYDILVAPASFITSDSEVNYLVTIVFVVLALVLHALVAKVRCVCASGADQSFYRAAGWCFFPVLFLLSATYLWIYINKETFTKVSDTSSSGLIQTSFLTCWLVVVFVTFYVWLEALKEGREGYYLVTDLTRFSARFQSRLQQRHQRGEKKVADRLEEEKKKEARREMLQRLQGRDVSHLNQRSGSQHINHQLRYPKAAASLSSGEDRPSARTRKEAASRRMTELGRPWKQRMNQLLARFAFIIVPVGSWPLTRGYGACRGLFRDSSCFFAIITLLFVALIASVSASQDCLALFLNSTLVQLIYLVVFALVRPFRIWFLNMMWLLIKIWEIVLNSALYSVVVSQEYGTSTAAALPILSVILLGLNATFVFYAVAVTFVERSMRNRRKLHHNKRAVEKLKRVQKVQSALPNRDLDAEREAHATLLLAASTNFTSSTSNANQNNTTAAAASSMKLSDKERDMLKYRHFQSYLDTMCETEEGDYMEWAHISKGRIAASLGTNKQSYMGGVGVGVGTGVITALSSATLRGRSVSHWEVQNNTLASTTTSSNMGDSTTEPPPYCRPQHPSSSTMTDAHDADFMQFRREYLLSLSQGPNPFK